MTNIDGELIEYQSHYTFPITSVHNYTLPNTPLFTLPLSLSLSLEQYYFFVEKQHFISPVKAIMFYSKKKKKKKKKKKEKKKKEK